MARRTRERYAEIRERLDAGQPEAAIRRATGLDCRTVQRYARAASAGELLASMSRESKLDEFKPHIRQRWNQGLTDAAQIHAELQQRGWAGSLQTVRRYVRLLRRAGPAVTPPGRAENPRDHPLAAVTPRQPRRRRPVPARRGQGLLALEDWLTRVEADDQPELHSFAAGIRRDQQASTAGLALPYSSAAMERNVNR